RLRADQERLLGDAVGRVRLLRVAVPELLLAERWRGELGVRADGPGEDELPDAGRAALLDHVQPHREVRVPVPAGVRAVRADPANLCREMEDDLGRGVREEPTRIGLLRQVVVPPPRDERVLTLLAQR